MTRQIFPVSSVSGNSRSTEQPIYPKKGGKITIGAFQPEIFFQIMCGTGGSVIILGVDGNAFYYPAVSAGQIIPAVGNGVLGASTIDGTPVTTTASNIWWYGGF